MDTISYAYGTNHFENDADLQAILHHYWPLYRDKRSELSRFGQFAGTDIYEAIYHIDHDARPVLVAHDLDGNRIDRVRLSPVEKKILADTTWIMEPPFHGLGWAYHYALLYLLGDPGLGCVLTITGQTAYALHKYAGKAIPDVGTITADLLSGRAFGATWMTESQGGSDLGANETIAQPDGEVWYLTGDKYFASGAGLSDYALTTAHPQGHKPGAKGLALFLLPRVNHQGLLNYHVRRLKDKSATRAVPSGEVELNRSEAYLIGRVEEGIYYTLETLTVSRLANAIIAMATAKKSHLEVMARVERRRSFGHVLKEHPLIRHDLTDLALRSAAGLALAFYGVKKFDEVWEEKPPYTPRYHFARFVTHLAKNRTADHASAMTAMAMELFGGLGFLEEYAVAHWHREALITPIWEGPSNIQALDFLESIQRHNAHAGLLDEIVPLLEQVPGPGARHTLEVLQSTLDRLESVKNPEAEWHAKEDLTTIADAVQVALLYDLAKDEGTRYAKLAELYQIHFIDHQDYPYWVQDDESIWGGGDHA